MAECVEQVRPNLEANIGAGEVRYFETPDAGPAHLRARIGFLSVLHTWGQNLMQNPHS